MHQHADKVAIITGATSGIGREAAKLFARQGISVVAAGRSRTAGNELVEEITAEGGQASFVQADIGDSNDVARLVASAETTYGGLDYAFNNAGIEGSFGPIGESEEANWDEVMRVNLKGVWLALKYEIPAIMRRGRGAIVNTSTNLTRVGVPGTGIYTASKAGVDALTRVAAIETASHGIRVNAVNPGGVDTPMQRRIFTEEQIAAKKKANPLGKYATAMDVAQAALWLCSSASGHITGETIVLDGGVTLQ